MRNLQPLVKDVRTASQSFIRSASLLTSAQTQFKPAENEWSIVDNVEHMYWAAMGGINGMWKALENSKKGTPIFTGEDIHNS